MSATVLLILAAGAIAVLLVLVIRARMSAFVSMILVSMVLALAARIPVGDGVQTMLDGMGKTLGTVVIEIGRASCRERV